MNHVETASITLFRRGVIASLTLVSRVNCHLFKNRIFLSRLLRIGTLNCLLLLSSAARAQIEPEMVLVRADCMEIGTLLLDQASNPLREVCLDDFLISKYEITFREYDLFTQETGQAARNDVGFGRNDRPVIDVSWFDAFAYAEWLSNETGKTYRLPTDAEWEFTARFDTEFGYKYTWGAEEERGKANCSDCGSQWDGKMTAPVGSFEPNTLGVYDLHGNVWEWTADCYYADSPKEEEGSHCKSGVVRGGSWDVNTGQLAFWIRAPQLSGKPARDTGFRLVMEP